MWNWFTGTWCVRELRVRHAAVRVVTCIGRSCALSYCCERLQFVARSYSEVCWCQECGSILHRQTVGVAVMCCSPVHPVHCTGRLSVWLWCAAVLSILFIAPADCRCGCVVLQSCPSCLLHQQTVGVAVMCCSPVHPVSLLFRSFRL